MKKGDVVWFVDGHWQDNGIIYYAEYGILVKNNKNGSYVVNSYFGDFDIERKKLFETKENCQNYIKKHMKETDHENNK